MVDGHPKRTVAVIRSQCEDHGQLNGKQGHVGAVVNIKEGPRCFVWSTSLNIRGLRQIQLKSLPVLTTPARGGRPYSDTNVALDRDYLITLYQSRGFAPPRMWR